MGAKFRYRMAGNWKDSIMYEELSPRVKRRGLYDGLAEALGEFLYGINGLGGKEIGDRVEVAGFVESVVKSVVEVLRRDNPGFNEARFRRLLTRSRTRK